jgi:hypothetical protein
MRWKHTSLVRGHWIKMLTLFINFSILWFLWQSILFQLHYMIIYMYCMYLLLLHVFFWDMLSQLFMEPCNMKIFSSRTLWTICFLYKIKNQAKLYHNNRVDNILYVLPEIIGNTCRIYGVISIDWRQWQCYYYHY